MLQTGRRRARHHGWQHVRRMLVKIDGGHGDRFVAILLRIPSCSTTTPTNLARSPSWGFDAPARPRVSVHRTAVRDSARPLLSFFFWLRRCVGRKPKGEGQRAESCVGSPQKPRFHGSLRAVDFGLRLWDSSGPGAVLAKPFGRASA